MAGSLVGHAFRSDGLEARCRAVIAPLKTDLICFSPSRGQGGGGEMAEYLLLSIEDRVATVTINRPDKGNSLSPEVLAEIEETFNGLSENAEVNVVVLTGGEKIFSAGFDLDYIKTIEKVSNEEFT